jgi:hypothetical protein
MTADRELIDVLLTERWTIGPLRNALAGRLPAGHRLVDLHDVWVGEPSLPSLIVAGDYWARISPDATAETVDHAQIGRVLVSLLAADEVPRTRTKGDRTIVDNLRPLLVDLRAVDAGCLWMRLRIDNALGTGRPDDVVEALATRLGTTLTVQARHRERLWLRDELALG